MKSKFKRFAALLAACSVCSGTLLQFPNDTFRFASELTAAAEGEPVAINETNFPDPVFRAYVDEYLDVVDDGVLTEGELALKSTDGGIYVGSMEISDLTGIEYFTGLSWLECDNNLLTNLNLSQNTALTHLSCGFNQLTNLDVSKNTALTEFWCCYNQLTTLDVSQNTALTYLDCYNNQLTSLDVSQNTALYSLGCWNNQLSILDVSKNTALKGLDCQQNRLTSLDVSKNTNLGFLNCGGNLLTELDVSKNTTLGYLECTSNQLTSLDVSRNTALTNLVCGDNKLTSLDVSNNTRLTDLFCYENRLTSLDVSKLTELSYLHYYDNAYEIDLIDGTFDLSTLPQGFDTAKASDWDNGSVNGSVLTVSDPTQPITYAYEIGNGETPIFELIPVSNTITETTTETTTTTAQTFPTTIVTTTATRVTTTTDEATTTTTETTTTTTQATTTTTIITTESTKSTTFSAEEMDQAMMNCDIDGDGRLTSADAGYITRYLCGLYTFPDAAEGVLYGDANLDGITNMTDVINITRNLFEGTQLIPSQPKDEKEPELCLAFDNVSGKPGELVDLDVYVEHFTGDTLCGFDLDLDFSSELIIADTRSYDLSAFYSNYKTDNPKIIAIAEYMPQIKEDSKILTISFIIPADAKVGNVYSVGLSSGIACYNYNYGFLCEAEALNGSIVVEEPTETTTEETTTTTTETTTTTTETTTTTTETTTTTTEATTTTTETTTTTTETTTTTTEATTTTTEATTTTTETTTTTTQATTTTTKAFTTTTMATTTTTETTTTTTKATTTTTKATTTTTETTTTTTKATTTTTETTTTTTRPTTTTTVTTTKASTTTTEATTETTTTTANISYDSDHESFDAVISIPEAEDVQPIEIITNGLCAVFDENAVLEMKNHHENQNIVLSYQVITDAPSNEQQEAVEEILNDGGKVFDLSLVDENGDSVQFSNDEAVGTVTITLPYKAAASNSMITVYYIAPDGTRTNVNASYRYDNETVTFTVSHFSVYAITEEIPAETTYTETTAETTTTTTTTTTSAETNTTEPAVTSTLDTADTEQTTTSTTAMESDLPQTGTNTLQMMLVFFGAVLLTGTGFWMILISGRIRRKE